MFFYIHTLTDDIEPCIRVNNTVLKPSKINNEYFSKYGVIIPKALINKNGPTEIFFCSTQSEISRDKDLATAISFALNRITIKGFK